MQVSSHARDAPYALQLLRFSRVGPDPAAPALPRCDSARVAPDAEAPSNMLVTQETLTCYQQELKVVELQKQILTFSRFFLV